MNQSNPKTDIDEIQSYLSSHTIRKLHLGAATNFLDGWLNVDIFPISGMSIYLDATQRFPFEDNSFDYVFSEHMIEHISHREGLFMLRECNRILRKGGVIRIATPNLAVLIDLYSTTQNDIQKRYIKWITDRFLPDIHVYKASYVINNAFYNWGHRFLYDSDLLKTLMEQAGFVEIKSCIPGQSSDEHLTGIEAHGKTIEDEELNQFETFVLEGRRS